MSPLGYNAISAFSSAVVDTSSTIGYSKLIAGIFIVPTTVNPLYFFFPEPLPVVVLVIGVSLELSNTTFSFESSVVFSSLVVTSP